MPGDDAALFIDDQPEPTVSPTKRQGVPPSIFRDTALAARRQLTRAHRLEHLARIKPEIGRDKRRLDADGAIVKP